MTLQRIVGSVAKVLGVLGLVLCMAFGMLYFSLWSVCTPYCHGANDPRYEGR